MLRRLILVLLLALGGVPASAMPAACHGMAAVQPARHPAHHQVVAGHGCIGCAAIGDWLAERVIAPRVVPSMQPPARLGALAPLAAGPPGLTPPRIG